MGAPSQVRLAEESRSNLLTISPRGRSLLESIYQLWSDTDQEIEAAIGLRDAQQLTDTTRRLRNVLGGFTPGSDSEPA